MEISSLNNLFTSLKRWAQEAYQIQPQLFRSLIGKILLSIILVLLVDYALLRWYAWFMDEALLKLNVKKFILGLALYGIILILSAFFEGYKNLFKDQLALKWREFLQNKMIQNYLSNHSFFWLNRTAQLDHPEQRLTDDIRDSTSKAVELFFGLIEVVFQFAIYAVVVISGSWLLFLFSLMYAWAGNKISLYLGRKLVSYQENQQKLEAHVRLQFTQIDQNAESIALLNNLANLQTRLNLQVNKMLENITLLITTKKNLKISDSLFNNLGIIFPYVIVSPFYFGGQITFGSLGMLSNAFFKIKNTFSYGISHFYEISELNASVNRLQQIQDFCKKNNEPTTPPRLSHKADSSQEESLIFVKQLTLKYAATVINQKPLSFSINRQELAVLTGKNGAGKSTLIRLLAGLHQDYEGEFKVAKNQFYFMPSNPFFYTDELLGYAQHTSFIELLNLQNLFINLTVETTKRATLASLQFSSGECQKIEWLKFLVSGCQFLIADEPFAHLDEKSTQAIWQYLKEQRFTALISTHVQLPGAAQVISMH